MDAKFIKSYNSFINYTKNKIKIICRRARRKEKARILARNNPKRTQRKPRRSKQTLRRKAPKQQRRSKKSNLNAQSNRRLQGNDKLQIRRLNCTSFGANEKHHY